MLRIYDIIYKSKPSDETLKQIRNRNHGVLDLPFTLTPSRSGLRRIRVGVGSGSRSFVSVGSGPRMFVFVGPGPRILVLSGPGPSLEIYFLSDLSAEIKFLSDPIRVQKFCFYSVWIGSGAGRARFGLGRIQI
jgi:hypothetical protein